MNYGYVKTCAATPKIKVSDIAENVNSIEKTIKSAHDAGARLLALPELCVTGYTCGDLFNQKVLVDSAEKAVGEICAFTKGMKTLVFVGAPIVSSERLYNCAVAISDGEILGVVPKTFLPNYGEFYERRHFTPASFDCRSVFVCGKEVPFGTDLVFCADNFPGFTVSAEICEDLWAPVSPSVMYTQCGANIIANLSCSDELVGKAEYRRDLVKMQSGKLICAYVYADAGDGESTQDMAFAGHDIISENGIVLCESELFKNGEIFADIDVEMLESERRRMSGVYHSNMPGRPGPGPAHDGRKIFFHADGDEKPIERKFSKTPFVPAGNEKLSERSELILSIQTKGLSTRLAHTNAKKAAIGLSGGLDSALALLVAVRAFNEIGKPLCDIMAVSMPGFGTTAGTKSNSDRLADALGVTSVTVPIGDSVRQHFKDIGQDEGRTDVTYENSQARTRTMILMDLANKNGGIVLGTGDLSEMALGWSTYNGDHMSMYGVNSGVPKTLVKHLVSYEAERIGGKAKDALTDILNTEISPELLPASEKGEMTQKTEDIIGPYILHDFFLYYAVRWGFAPEKVRRLASLTFDEYDDETIDKWLNKFYERFFSNQFKRSCVPDGVKVGSVALSPRGDWRMPSDAVPYEWIKNLD